MTRTKKLGISAAVLLAAVVVTGAALVLRTVLREGWGALPL